METKQAFTLTLTLTPPAWMEPQDLGRFVLFEKKTNTFCSYWHNCLFEHVCASEKGKLRSAGSADGGGGGQRWLGASRCAGVFVSVFTVSPAERDRALGGPPIENTRIKSCTLLLLTAGEWSAWKL